MKAKKVILMLFAIVIVSPCIAQKSSQTKEEKQLMELSREWAMTAKNGTPEQIASYWTEDAILMTPDQGKIVGREQLIGMIKGSSDIPGFEVGWEPKEARVAQSGDLGYVIASKYVKVPDDTGNLITLYFVEVGIWEKQKDGTWKNTIDIYNPDPTVNSVNN